MPKVSVIMPAYNAEKYIAQAIESILEQTFGDFEFIILNDCSRDRTEQIILSYGDSRIVYLKNEQNMGVAATLNKGLAAAAGEYIARMDADDISLPQRLQKQAAYLDSNLAVAVLGTNVESFSEQGTISTGWSATDPEQMKTDLFFSCGLAHPCVMMRRSVIAELGGYDMAFEGLEDYDLWCRVLENHQITTLPDILLRYRVHSAQVTKNPSPQYRARMRLLKARQLKQLGMDPACPEAEACYALCAGTAPTTAEELALLRRFCEMAAQANESTRFYSQGLLEASFRAILLRSAAALPKEQRTQTLAGSRLVTAADLRKYLLKQKVRKLLGRG